MKNRNEKFLFLSLPSSFFMEKGEREREEREDEEERREKKRASQGSSQQNLVQDQDTVKCSNSQNGSRLDTDQDNGDGEGWNE